MLGLCSVVGIAVGEPEIVGCDETLGRRLGVSVGTPVGIAVGEPGIVGCDETLGRRLGVSVGTPVGIELGVDVGALEVVGRDVGTSDGRVVGRSDGDGVGEKDGAGVVGIGRLVGAGIGVSNLRRKIPWRSARSEGSDDHGGVVVVAWQGVPRSFPSSRFQFGATAAVSAAKLVDSAPISVGMRSQNWFE